MGSGPRTAADPRRGLARANLAMLTWRIAAGSEVLLACRDAILIASNEGRALLVL